MSLMNEFESAGWDRLRMAVIMRACNDYFICKRALNALTGDGQIHTAWGHISNTQKTLDDCIDFFNGAWYRALANASENPGLNGIYIMRRLDEIVEDTNRWPGMGDIFKYGEDDVDEDAYKRVS